MGGVGGGELRLHPLAPRRGNRRTMKKLFSHEVFRVSPLAFCTSIRSLVFIP
jgi:hypothetical protein